MGATKEGIYRASEKECAAIIHALREAGFDDDFLLAEAIPTLRKLNGGYETRELSAHCVALMQFAIIELQQAYIRIMHSGGDYYGPLTSEELRQLIEGIYDADKVDVSLITLR